MSKENSLGGGHILGNLYNCVLEAKLNLLLFSSSLRHSSQLFAYCLSVFLAISFVYYIVNSELIFIPYRQFRKTLELSFFLDPLLYYARVFLSNQIYSNLIKIASLIFITMFTITNRYLT